MLAAKAMLLKNGSLEGVIKLLAPIQTGIAKHLLPNALKRAVEADKIQMPPSHRQHNRIWTSLFKNDAWFEVILDLATETSPILIGKNLSEGGQYLVLNSMDYLERLQDMKDVRLKNYLHPHTFDRKTCECTMEGSNSILNISEVMSWNDSVVPELTDTLLKNETDNSKSTQVLYLKHSQFYKYKTTSNQGGDFLELSLSRYRWPYDGSSRRTVCCVDSAERAREFSETYGHPEPPACLYANQGYD